MQLRRINYCAHAQWPIILILMYCNLAFGYSCSASMSGLKLYADKLSPVCRPVMLLLAANNIEYEYVYINLREGAHIGHQELIAANPNTQVPAIDDNGFTLFDSVAILRYICQRYELPDHWYPSDLHARAKVDEALAWFPGNLHCGCYLQEGVLPVLYKLPRNEAKCTETRETLKKSLDVVESYFLKGKKFVGGDEISIADLSFLCEVTQYWMVDCDIYKGRPNMERWLDECRKMLATQFEPHHDVVCDIQKAGTFHCSIDVGQAK